MIATKITGKKVYDGSVAIEGYIGVFPEARQIVTRPNAPWSYSDKGYIVSPFSELPNIVQNYGYHSLFEFEDDCVESVYKFAHDVCRNRKVTKKMCRTELVKKVRYSVKLEGV